MRPIQPPRLVERPARPGRRAQQVIVYRGNEYPTGFGPDQAAEALRALATFIEDLGRETGAAFGEGPADPSEVTVQSCLDYYREQRRAKYDRDLGHTDPHAAKKRKGNLDGELAPLARYFGAKTLTQITITLAEKYVPWRCAQRDARAKNGKGKLIAATTAKRELVTLSAAINFCHKDKRVKGTSTFIKIPGDYVRRDRYLTRGEVAKLLLGALGFDLRTGKRNRYRINRHAARALLIGFYTGSRLGVIRKLGWIPSTVNGWFDIERGHLYRSPQDAVETNKKRPTCEIPDKLMRKHLRRWRALSARYVIEHEGQQVTSLKRSLKGAQQLSGLGVEVTSHILRHTCITLKLHAGVAIEDVAAFVGVSPEIIRKHYLHHAVAQSRAAANAGF